MKKFKPGDRVITIKASEDLDIGETGTVIGYHSDGSSLGVDWDHFENGHECKDIVDQVTTCKESHGWFVNAKIVRLIENDTCENSSPDEFNVYSILEDL